MPTTAIDAGYLATVLCGEQVSDRIRNLVYWQLAQFRRNCWPDVPEWYETRRKTTHVVFWS